MRVETGIYRRIALWGLLVVSGAVRAADAKVELRGPLVGDMAVRAYWARPVDSTYGLVDNPAYAKLFDLKPAVREKTYDGAAFAAFLPAAPVAVGEVWPLEKERLLPFLRQFHAGATLDLGPGAEAEGAYACLRALSADHAEIDFRVHAAFVLEGGRGYYTPAQFAGSVVIERKSGRVHSFRFSLPSRNSNVDVRGEGGADILFVPRMELVGGEPLDVTADPGAASIPLEDVRDRFAKKFYKSAAIDWVPFSEARVAARKEGKPIFLLVIFGTLDDESC